METPPELRRLLHDLQSKSASLKSAAQLLRECPPARQREMIPLMIQETQEILRCLSDYDKLIREG
ncbi:MAG: hypothetical protein WC728_11495 [Elusimicrobiota bacterium]